MRRTREQVEQTRRQIVAAASRRFRTAGTAKSGISQVMHDLRLTHGGFYRHFGNKDQLFREALEASVLETQERLVRVAEGVSPGRAFTAIVDAYLSESHCRHPDQGCPLAALGSDISRLPRPSRDACQRALAEYARHMARYMPGGSDRARQRRAGVLFSSMAGTLTYARTISDLAAQAQLLADARAMFKRI